MSEERRDRGNVNDNTSATNYFWSGPSTDDDYLDDIRVGLWNESKEPMFAIERNVDFENEEEERPEHLQNGAIESLSYEAAQFIVDALIAAGVQPTVRGRRRKDAADG